MNETTITIRSFIAQHNIKASAEYGAADIPDDFQNSDPWTVTLRRGRKQITIPFFMGYGHNGEEPTAADVLDCLASDACGYDNARSFDDWCAEYGYDTDSRKAEKTYRAIERQSKKLEKFLGTELYQSLLYSVDRL